MHGRKASNGLFRSKRDVGRKFVKLIDGQAGRQRNFAPDGVEFVDEQPELGKARVFLVEAGEAGMKPARQRSRPEDSGRVWRAAGRAAGRLRAFGEISTRPCLRFRSGDNPRFRGGTRRVSGRALPGCGQGWRNRTSRVRRQRLAARRSRHGDGGLADQVIWHSQDLHAPSGDGSRFCQRPPGGSLWRA